MQHRTLPLSTYSKDTLAFVPNNEAWQVDLQAKPAADSSNRRGTKVQY